MKFALSFIICLVIFVSYSNSERAQLKAKLSHENLILDKLLKSDSLSNYVNNSNHSKHLLTEALNEAILINHSFLICSSLSKLISIELDQGNFNEATEHLTYLKYEIIKHKHEALIFELIMLYINYYSFNRQFDIALKYDKELLKFAIAKNDEEWKGKSYLSLSGDIGMIGHLDKAIEYCDSAFYFATITNNAKLKLQVYINKFALVRQNGDLKNAAQYALYAKEISDSLAYSKYYVYIYEMLGTSNLDEGLYAQALTHYSEGLSFAIDSENKQYEFMFYDRISFAYEFMGNVDSAYHYYILYKQLESKVINDENYQKTLEINNSVDKKLKDLEIDSLQFENDALIQKRKINLLLIGIFILISLFLSAISIILYRNIKFRKKAISDLIEKNKEIEEQSNRLNIQTKLISKFQSQMNPHFYANVLNGLQGLIISDEKTVAIDQIQKVSLLMRQTIVNSDKDFILITEEINYLKDYILFMKGFLDYVIKIEIDMKCDDDIIIPPMMLQPFIENILKHAKLSRKSEPVIQIKIDSKNHFLNISISDNGCGFLLDKNLPKNHALDIFKSRQKLWFQQEGLTYNESYFKITSTIDIGTTVFLNFPLKYIY